MGLLAIPNLTQIGQKFPSQTALTIGCVAGSLLPRPQLPKTKDFELAKSLLTTFGSNSSRIIKTGQDPSSLGHWCWQLHQGKAGWLVRIISAYCPTPTHGNGLVFTQHVTHFLHQGNHTDDPQERFVSNLGAEICQFQLKDKRIVLGLDANYPLTVNNAFTRAMTNLGLRTIGS